MSGIINVFPEIADPVELRRQVEAFSITRPVVIFAISARVGSTGLLALLSRKFGFTDIFEIFNPRGVADVIARDAKLGSFEAYMRHLDNMLAGKIFAIKTSWNDFDFLSDTVILSKLFPNARFIYLDRVDIEAQALSLFVAEQTNRWHLASDARSDEIETIKYDRYRIDSLLRDLQSSKLAWMEFFGRNKLIPLVLYYEAIRDCAQHALLAICEKCGIEGVGLDQMPDWRDGRFAPTTNAHTRAVLSCYLADRFPAQPRDVSAV